MSSDARPSSHAAEHKPRITMLTKRSGASVHFDSAVLSAHLTALMADDLNVDFVKIPPIIQRVRDGLPDRITTVELTKLVADMTVALVSDHPDHGRLAARIVASSIHKETSDDWIVVLEDLRRTDQISPHLMRFALRHRAALNKALVYSRDLTEYDLFGMRTLLASYLLRVGERTVERPQHMLMRVACGMHMQQPHGNVMTARGPAVAAVAATERKKGPTSSRGAGGAGGAGGHESVSALDDTVVDKVDDDADDQARLAAAIETYDLMSRGVFTHASPTLFNCGTKRPQLASCFLLPVADDSVEGIYDTLGDCARISKSAGGIGLSIHGVRGSGSAIGAVKGAASGLRAMLQVFNKSTQHISQNGKRRGALTCYLEPWHVDIEQFIDLRNNQVHDSCHDVFCALWVCDLFMRRVQSGGTWSLMCPHSSPGLHECWGDEFDALYTRYESEGRFVRQIPARKLFGLIIKAQIETGGPFMLFKDSCNRKSNQQNLGTIQGSNLCTEIIQYSSPTETAVCNLASVALPKFVVDLGEYDENTGRDGVASASASTSTSAVGEIKSSLSSTMDEYVVESVTHERRRLGFDHGALARVIKIMTRNLNRVVDVTTYPIQQALDSNVKHRPIGLGVQGLADVFSRLRLPFESPAARRLNREIFETIYFAACTASNELAARDGSYSSFAGSPMSIGIFQWQMWEAESAAKVAAALSASASASTSASTLGSATPLRVQLSGRWDWDALRQKITQPAANGGGMRNSLLVAPMPTATTSQILGNSECIDPHTNNISVRRTLAGDFTVVNRHMVEDLIKLDIWTPELKERIIANNGSIQNIAEISEEVRLLYRTVWEIRQRAIVEMAVDRGVFVDQSQSLNIHLSTASPEIMQAMHMLSWTSGLKTGMYYLRTRAAVDAVKVTVPATMRIASNSTPTAKSSGRPGMFTPSSSADPPRPHHDDNAHSQSHVHGTTSTVAPAVPVVPGLCVRGMADAGECESCSS